MLRTGRFVRLFLRKTNAWFRIGRLQYPNDIVDIEAACATLQSRDVGFADADNCIRLEEAAALLNLDELKAVAKDAKCAGGGGNKAQMIAALKKACKAQGGLQAWGGQLKLNFDARGNPVNRETHFVGIVLDRTGKSAPLARCHLGSDSLSQVRASVCRRP